MTQRVLVIDDERGVGDQIRGLLAEDGVDCELAEDALVFAGSLWVVTRFG